MSSSSVVEILNQPPSSWSRTELVHLLKAEDEERKLLFQSAAQAKLEQVGNKVFLRGLIEYSNKCSKNCFYCGIRAGNTSSNRYELSVDEVLEAARFALDNRYGSIVLQSGERSDQAFIEKIDQIIQEIKSLSKGKLGITLSLGEQKEETYMRWRRSGAHRYLLRIESSDPVLYYQIHPKDSRHDFDYRISCLHNLKYLGYQVGTGVMIGLPFQTLDHLAGDLLFIRDLDADMVGMGPYIEHKDTPLYQYNADLMPLDQRFALTLKMIAILRLLMPDINIAATTALQTIDKIGREKAIQIGANIMMPNITPAQYRGDYSLYENKPCTDENAEDCGNCMDMRVQLAGSEIGYGEWGDSIHFRQKNEAGNLSENL
jgi:biotin synthase